MVIMIMTTIILDLRDPSSSLVMGTASYTCIVLFCTGTYSDAKTESVNCLVKLSAENLLGRGGHRYLSSCL